MHNEQAIEIIKKIRNRKEKGSPDHQALSMAIDAMNREAKTMTTVDAPAANVFGKKE